LSRHRYTSNRYTLISDLPVEELAREIRSIEVLLVSDVSMLEQCALLSEMTSSTHVLDPATGKGPVEERPSTTVSARLRGGAVGAYEALTKHPKKSPDLAGRTSEATRYSLTKCQSYLCPVRATRKMCCQCHVVMKQSLGLCLPTSTVWLPSCTSTHQLPSLSCVREKLAMC
jgi:hypothetical protein